MRIPPYSRQVLRINNPCGKYFPLSEYSLTFPARRWPLCQNNAYLCRLTLSWGADRLMKPPERTPRQAPVWLMAPAMSEREKKFFACLKDFNLNHTLTVFTLMLV